jgi:hypothetical protein
LLGKDVDLLRDPRMDVAALTDQAWAKPSQANEREHMDDLTNASPPMLILFSKHQARLLPTGPALYEDVSGTWLHYRLDRL